jgi:hypothetical protein
MFPLLPPDAPPASHPGGPTIPPPAGPVQRQAAMAKPPGPLALRARADSRVAFVHARPLAGPRITRSSHAEAALGCTPEGAVAP